MNGENSTTKPTLETILERINSQGKEFREALERLTSEVGELREGQASIRAEVGELREGQASIRAEVGELREGQASIRTELHEFRIEQKELNEEILMRLRKIEKQVLEFADVYWERRIEMRDVKRRLDKLEGDSA
jgi:chromosome segregation ATPase